MDDLKFVVGLSDICQFVVLDLFGEHRVILQNVPVNHSGAFHILYSKAHKRILTVGSGVKMYSLRVLEDFNPSRRIKPGVDIQFVGHFADGIEFSILNPPPLIDGVLYVPTPKGIQEFLLDGSPGRIITGVRMTHLNAFDICPITKRVIMTDGSNGVYLLRHDGSILRKFPSVMVSVFTLRFVDEEHVVFLTPYSTIGVLNIRTGRAINCLSLNSTPVRLMIFGRPINLMAYTHEANVVMLRIEAIWKTWALNIEKATTLRRINRIRSPGRLLVLSSDFFVKVFSIRRRFLITSATPNSSGKPQSIVYDRNNFDNQLLIAMDNGQVEVFQTTEDPAIFFESKQLDCCKLVLGDESMLIGCSNSGKIFFLSPEDLSVTKCFHTNGCNAVDIVQVNDGVIAIFENSVCFLRNNQTQQFPIKKPNCCGVFGGWLLLGYKNGSISRFPIKDSLMIDQEERRNRPHSACVTSFGCSEYFWVSSSMDGSLIIWDEHFFSICTIQLPLPIFCVVVLNGWRDMIVSTETELMIIYGSKVFGNEIDEEDPLIDSYDRLEEKISEPVDKDSDVDAVGFEDTLQSAFLEETTQSYNYEIQPMEFLFNAESYEPNQEHFKENPEELLDEMLHIIGERKSIRFRQQPFGMASSKQKNESKSENSPSSKKRIKKRKSSIISKHSSTSSDEYYDYEEEDNLNGSVDKSPFSEKGNRRKHRHRRKKRKSCSSPHTSSNSDIETFHPKRRRKKSVANENKDFQTDSNGSYKSDDEKGHRRKRRKKSAVISDEEIVGKESPQKEQELIPPSLDSFHDSDDLQIQNEEPLDSFGEFKEIQEEESTHRTNPRTRNLKQRTKVDHSSSRQSGSMEPTTKESLVIKRINKRVGDPELRSSSRDQKERMQSGPKVPKKGAFLKRKLGKTPPFKEYSASTAEQDSLYQIQKAISSGFVLDPSVAMTMDSSSALPRSAGTMRDRGVLPRALSARRQNRDMMLECAAGFIGPNFGTNQRRPFMKISDAQRTVIVRRSLRK